MSTATGPGHSADPRHELVGLSSVSHDYGKHRALADVDLTFGGTGVTVLLGRNGAGKSTLCRILAGVEKPSRGTLRRAGVKVDSGERLRKHHARTGWLPQTPTMPGALTVTQYVRYAAWLKGLRGQRSEQAIERAVTRTNLGTQRSQRLSQLSGGMQRRAAIAQAIVHEPSFMILDEPTAGLDPEQRAWFHTMIAGLATERSVLLSTHLLEDVEMLATRVVVLDAGVIRFDDDVAVLARRGGEGAGLTPQAALRAGFLSLVQREEQ